MPEVKRPFYRQATTIVPPWDPDSDMTVEILILPETIDVDRYDLAELQQAGWRQSTIKGLEVYIRLVG